MKRFYYEVGEVFRKDRKRYVVKEAPECTGMDYACDRDYRDDNKSVVFAELGNATKD